VGARQELLLEVYQRRAVRVVALLVLLVGLPVKVFLVRETTVERE
jgi:hypothetical protein